MCRQTAAASILSVVKRLSIRGAETNIWIMNAKQIRAIVPASLLLAALVALVPACAQNAPQRRPLNTAPSSSGGMGTPMEPNAPQNWGRGGPSPHIWDNQRDRWLAPEMLRQLLGGARYVLLGEMHDNPAHHRWQAHAVRMLAEQGRRPAVAWEMITTAQADALARWRARAGTAAELGPAVRWEARGWPAWRLYQPIAEAALAHELRLVPANLPRAALHTQASAALDAERARQLGVQRWLPDAAEQQLRAELVAAHCGHASEPMLTQMTRAQQLRDAHMAAQLVRHASASGAVLIAGSAHARSDRGVPFYLAQHANVEADDILSVGFVEMSQIESEDKATAAQKQPYDLVWLTEPVEREDPCAAFQKQHDKEPASAKQNEQNGNEPD